MRAMFVGRVRRSGLALLTAFVVLAGLWTRDASAQAPGRVVFKHNGQALPLSTPTPAQ